MLPHNYKDPDFGMCNALKYLPLPLVIRQGNVLLEMQT